MQTRKLWNSVYLSIKQISLMLCFVFAAQAVSAQEETMNNYEHETDPYYFGITIGFNASQYKVSPSKYFVDYDTIQGMTPLWRPGFHVGIIGNLRLSSFVDLRTIPTFMIRENALKFSFPGDSVQESSFESVLYTMPWELKFKSNRQSNYRFYVAAGGHFDVDFTANARSKRKDDILKIKAFDYGYNVGLGFEFYFPNFIFAPEIKLSNGLGNVLLRNAGEPTNKAIDNLTTRMIVVSFQIQG